ncbi:hypothetical protein ACFQ6N_39810 [Kitasatospora sp. NPDC056446]|uniref:hypothetical protein n=1 Tax=Kitasatospora sp. NPDC056446 TaxID=3345819 RepID=UPI00369864C4
MVTAQSPLRTRRARPRGVAARLLWLGALLVAVFAAHGLSVENGAGHTDLSRIVWSEQAPAPCDDAHAAQPAHQEQHDDDHPGGECLSGKPEDGPGTDVAGSAVRVQPAAVPAPTAPSAGPADGTAATGAPELPHRIARLRV